MRCDNVSPAYTSSWVPDTLSLVGVSFLVPAVVDSRTTCNLFLVLSGITSLPIYGYNKPVIGLSLRWAGILLVGAQSTSELTRLRPVSFAL